MYLWSHSHYKSLLVFPECSEWPQIVQPPLLQLYKSTKHFKLIMLRWTDLKALIWKVDFKWFTVICVLLWPPSARIQPQPCAHLSCTCTPPPSISTHLSCHSSYHSLTLTPPLPPSCFPSSSSSSSYLSPWFIGGGVQFTHIPLLTTPSPATGLSYLGSVVYLHNPPTERRRGESERDGTIGVVFVEQARLSFHTPLSASQGVVSGACMCVLMCVWIGRVSLSPVSKFPGPPAPTWKNPWSLYGEQTAPWRNAQGFRTHTHNDPCHTLTGSLAHSLMQAHHIHNPQSTNPHPCTPPLARPN